MRGRVERLSSLTHFGQFLFPRERIKKFDNIVVLASAHGDQQVEVLLYRLEEGS